MIQETFLPPPLITLTPAPSPLFVISLGIILTAALLTYIRPLRRQRDGRQLYPDPEYASAASPLLADAKTPPPPPPTLPNGATYTDLPPPLRTTIHAPLVGHPCTSADLASHPWSRHTYTLPSQLPPPQLQHHHQQQQAPNLAQPPSDIHVTDTLQYFPLSTPPTPPLPQRSQSYPQPQSSKGWRRRRTLVFENVAASRPDDGSDRFVTRHAEVEGGTDRKMEGDGVKVSEQPQQQRRAEQDDVQQDSAQHEQARAKPGPATVVLAEADVWARMASTEVDI